MTVFTKRDHLGASYDFDLGIWPESTLHELPLALYCALLARSVAEMVEPHITQASSWPDTCSCSAQLVKQDVLCG